MRTVLRFLARRWSVVLAAGLGVIYFVTAPDETRAELEARRSAEGYSDRELTYFTIWALLAVLVVAQEVWHRLRARRRRANTSEPGRFSP